MLIDTDGPQNARLPVFLKTLCILTFISCGIAVITTVYGLSQGEAVLKDSIEQLQQVSVPEDAHKLELAYSKNEQDIAWWSKTVHYLMIANIIVSLAGAMLMWKRRKAGFYIYALGRVFPFIGAIGLTSAMIGLPYFGMLTLIKGILAIVISIVFVILYGMNLKHMK